MSDKLPITICIPSYENDPFTDNLVPRLEKENVSDVLVYKKGSFAVNCNAMAKDAKTEYILFLNNDTYPEYCFAEKLLNSIKRPDEWMVGPKIVFSKNVIKHVVFNERVNHVFGIKDQVQCAWIDYNEQFMPYEFGRLKAQNNPLISSRRRVLGVSGCVMLVKREKFLELGGFDEHFVNGWEDNDFNLKVLEAGGIGVYNPYAVVKHEFAGSDSIGRFDKEQENYDYFIRKWGSRRVSIIRDARKRING